MNNISNQITASVYEAYKLWAQVEKQGGEARKYAYKIDLQPNQKEDISITNFVVDPSIENFLKMASNCKHFTLCLGLSGKRQDSSMATFYSYFHIGAKSLMQYSFYEATVNDNKHTIDNMYACNMMLDKNLARFALFGENNALILNGQKITEDELNDFEHSEILDVFDDIIGDMQFSIDQVKGATKNLQPMTNTRSRQIAFNKTLAIQAIHV